MPARPPAGQSPPPRALRGLLPDRLPRMKTLAVALLLTFATAAAAPAQLALTGETFHGDEVPARDGETWLALVVENGQARLQSTALQVKPVEDPVLDEDGQMSGRSVTAPGLQPVVLLRGMAGLKAGPVALATVEGQPPDAGARAAAEQARPLAVGKTLSFGLGERRWELSAEAGSPGGKDSGNRIDIALREGDTAQILLRSEGYRENGILTFGDAVPRLLFAGDLDGDGRLDLLLDTTDHYSLSRPTLFLSGAARKGELLHQAAQLSLSGS
jgi:hypothetical protein